VTFDPFTVQVLHLQFSTKYLRWDGTWCQRVTTISRRWANSANVHDIARGFDQEAAAVVLARYITWKMEAEDDFDATRWIDRSLIRLCQRCVRLVLET
jgi:protein transport protein SEC23